MTEMSINGISYSAIPIHPFDRFYDHPLVKPLHLQPATLAWLRPTSINTSGATKRPLVLRGPAGNEVVFVDRNCELVLCIESRLHPEYNARREEPTMRTSEIRKSALRLAHHLYETCSGQLRFSDFDIDEEAKKLGYQTEAEAEAIFAYLTSSRVMESPYIGSGRVVRFTDYGISVIEAGIDRPNDASGPFPPLSVVIGDIGAGAQVAIGAGHFTQMRRDSDNPNLLRDLVPLLQAASAGLQANGRDQEATLLAVAQNEAQGQDCDMGFLKSALGRFAKTVANGAIDTASQALLAYCKAHGFLP